MYDIQYVYASKNTPIFFVVVVVVVVSFLLPLPLPTWASFEYKLYILYVVRDDDGPEEDNKPKQKKGKITKKQNNIDAIFFLKPSNHFHSFLFWLFLIVFLSLISSSLIYSSKSRGNHTHT